MAKDIEKATELKHFGDPLINWSVDGHTRHERSFRWYILVSIIGVGLIIYALMTANFLFAVIILMIGVISFLAGLQEPQRIDIHLTNNGLLIGEKFYPFKAVKDFSVVYEPPEVKLLYIDMHSNFKPLISVPLEDADPVAVRECLLPYVFENLERSEETLTDLLSRLYKL